MLLLARLRRGDAAEDRSTRSGRVGGEVAAPCGIPADWERRGGYRYRRLQMFKSGRPCLPASGSPGRRVRLAMARRGGGLTNASG